MSITRYTEFTISVLKPHTHFIIRTTVDSRLPVELGVFSKKGGINWFDGMIGICDLLFLENCIGTVSCILIH